MRNFSFVIFADFQARVQMQIISQLETQLHKEKEVLTAMMKHLHPEDGGRESPAKRLKADVAATVTASSPGPMETAAVTMGRGMSLPDIMKSQQQGRTLLSCSQSQGLGQQAGWLLIGHAQE